MELQILMEKFKKENPRSEFSDMVEEVGNVKLHNILFFKDIGCRIKVLIITDLHDKVLGWKQEVLA